MKDIDPKKVEAGEVVAKLTDEESEIVLRARTKIDATKATIDHLVNEIARQYRVIQNLWDKYDYSPDVTYELFKRGLTLTMTIKTKEIKISKISDGELKQALFHHLLW